MKMRQSARLTPVLLMTLAACATSAPMPELTGPTKEFPTARQVIYKGTYGARNTPAKLVEHRYRLACETEGSPVQPRADRAIAIIRASDKVFLPIGPGYQESFERKRLNAKLIPQTQCRVSTIEPRVISKDPLEVMKFAISSGALAELRAKK